MSILVFVILLLGIFYYIFSKNNELSSSENVTEYFLLKSYSVSAGDIEKYNRNIETENTIEKYEARIKKEYSDYFTEKGMILSIANRDTEWLIQAASNYKFTTTVKNITLTIREETTSKRVYDYKLLLVVELENKEIIENEYFGYIEFSLEKNKWLIDRCRIDQDLKSIIN